MRRITIRLTDQEYADLEQRAANERRSVREMAERLVTAPPAPQWSPYLPSVPSLPPQWWQNPVISTDCTGGNINTPICVPCMNPISTAAHTCFRVQNTVSATAVN
jgi:hypothetical protein